MPLLGMLFVVGWQTILRDGINPRRVLVGALASALGLGVVLESPELGGRGRVSDY